MNKKWIKILIFIAIAIIMIVGFIWFIKDITWIAGIYYFISLVVSFILGWVASSKIEKLPKKILND